MWSRNSRTAGSCCVSRCPRSNFRKCNCGPMCGRCCRPSNTSTRTTSVTGTSPWRTSCSKTVPSGSWISGCQPWCASPSPAMRCDTSAGSGRTHTARRSATCPAVPRSSSSPRTAGASPARSRWPFRRTRTGSARCACPLTWRPAGPASPSPGVTRCRPWTPSPSASASSPWLGTRCRGPTPFPPTATSPSSTPEVSRASKTSYALGRSARSPRTRCPCSRSCCCPTPRRAPRQPSAWRAHGLRRWLVPRSPCIRVQRRAH
mmetsp:Transcript_42316/g.122843  ORF Transcript_42316/g.122843 Transcript_42316/m.122843 type:complete len:261 (+) Transcript_42316:636-1418(+)